MDEGEANLRLRGRLGRSRLHLSFISALSGIHVPTVRQRSVAPSGRSSYPQSYEAQEVRGEL